MTDLRTARLTLHPVDVAEAERILTGRPGPGDRWAEDFPFEGDVIALQAFVGAAAVFGEPGALGHHLVVRSADATVVGGIGFKGPASDGCAEVGYGLVPSARGQGFAAEALVTLTDLARSHGLTRLLAETTPENLASRRTLTRAGFEHVGDEAGLLLHARDLS